MAISQSTYSLVRLGAAGDNWNTLDNVRVRKIWWVGATDASHTLAVYDSDNSNIIAEGIAGDLRNVCFDFDPPLNVDGVHVETMGSGAVLVYVV